MQTASSPRGRLRRSLSYLRPFRGGVAAILSLVLVIGALNALEPLILKSIFDELGGGRRWQTIALGVGLLIAAGLLRDGLGAVSNWLTWRTRISVHYSLMEETVGRLHRLPLSFHREEGVGATLTRLERGIQGFVGMVTDIAFNVIPAATYLVISICVMLKLDWRLALLVLAFTPGPALITRWAATRQTAREKNLMDRWVKIYARFNEVLSGIVTVKSFAMEEREKQRFLHEVYDANGVVIRGVGFDSRVSLTQNGVILLARVAALALGSWLALRGDITAGTLVAFLGYVGGVFAPVQGLSGTYRTLRTASVAMDQVFHILDTQDHLGDAPDAEEVTGLRGEVEFDDVHFAYSPDRSSPLINGISLHVRPGENIALVGPSGAGKSTLMALLCRFYDPLSGAVRIDGRDIRGLKQMSLRRNIGVVLQESLLFNESVRANIAYGRPEATQEQIEEAAKAAHAHEFIMRLPQGYDTFVGERGSRLSMGERQRIAIARSLLKNPPILILDEPTSALDAESEALVQEALGRLMKGRTTFAIAHRLSTVVDADRILVLKGGHIVEEGGHARLMALDGYYASLVRRQTRGLLPVGPLIAEPSAVKGAA
ncbi:MAG TPA: ABC transporter ATP-binding protein [Hyalangium sp.]|nr:ABC transporter ATP-binding protein [Hyalangium sp.]